MKTPVQLEAEWERVKDHITDAPAREIRILAFDPGITAMGWVLLIYNLDTGHVTVIRHGLLTGAHMLKLRKELQHKFSKSFIVLDVYYHVFCELIVEHAPHFVVTEGAFYYRHVQAYASLTLVIHTLRRACKDTLGYDLHEVAPMETKKVVTGKGNADKDQIKAALLARANLTIVETEDDPLADFTEHEFDAAGHGLAFITLVFPTILANRSLPLILA